MHMRYRCCEPICKNCQDCDSEHLSLLQICSTVNTNRGAFIITNVYTAIPNELLKKKLTG